MSFTMILGVLVIAGIVGQVIGLINGLGVRSKAGRDLMSHTYVLFALNYCLPVSSVCLPGSLN